MKALALGFLLFATTPIVIDTTQLAEGGKEARFEGSRRVTVEKLADGAIVRIQEDARIDTVTIHRERDGLVKITCSNNGGKRPFMAMDRPPVIVDGLDLEPFINGGEGERSEITIVPPGGGKTPPMPSGPSYYACPKDATMLRVPNAPPGATYKCPVDGTVMKKSHGRDQKYWLLD